MTRKLSTRIGDRLAPDAGWFRRAWHYHGLSIALVALFAASMIGQTWAGWVSYNEDQMDHGEAPVTLVAYLATGHFGEATFENWESEFLQMCFYVLLTTVLYQVGSSESKRPDVVEAVDLDPRRSPRPDEAPWPVRRGGLALTLYENSLSLTFGALFVASFVLHGVSGAREYSEDLLAHGQQAVGLADYMTSARFWFESFQNWQSEFLSLAAMVLLTIFLRQRGSPESKPVDAPMWETAD